QQLDAGVSGSPDNPDLDHDPLLYPGQTPLGTRRKKPPAGQGGFLRYQTVQRGRSMPAARGMSALRELLAASRLVEADLLALDLARIPRDQPCLRQHRLESVVEIDQRAGDAVANRACLARLPATVHVDLDVEGRAVVGQRQRLANDHATGFAREVLVDRLAVDDDTAVAALQEDSRHRRLAPAGAVVVLTNHR